MASSNKTFWTDLDFSIEGQKMVEEYIKQFPQVEAVKDYTNDKDKQLKDGIDLEVFFKDSPLRFCADCKIDRYHNSPYLFIEEECSGKVGSFFGHMDTVNMIVYFFPTNRVCFFIWLQPFKEWYDNNKDNYRTIFTNHTKGRLVLQEDVIKLDCVRKINI